MPFGAFQQFTRPFQPIAPQRSPFVGLGRTRDEEGNPLLKTLNEQVELARIKDQEREVRKKQKTDQIAKVVESVFG